jgi:Peptidase S24-like
MFVTHIKGNSMEPLIPHDALCACRTNVSEPYNGKILLLEDYGEAGGNRYTVERYECRFDQGVCDGCMNPSLLNR